MSVSAKERRGSLSENLELASTRENEVLLNKAQGDEVGGRRIPHPAIRRVHFANAHSGPERLRFIPDPRPLTINAVTPDVGVSFLAPLLPDPVFFFLISSCCLFYF